MMMAGLDGMQNKIDPGEPLDKDIYDLSPEEMKKRAFHAGVARRGARAALEDDHGFLLEGRRVQRRADRDFIDYKRRTEAEAVRLRPHPTSSLCTTTFRRLLVAVV